MPKSQKSLQNLSVQERLQFRSSQHLPVKKKRRRPNHFWWNLFCFCCKRKTVREKKTILFGENTDKSFKMIDADGSGTITYVEILKTFKSIRCPITTEEAKDIVAKFDTDGDGYIDQEEFSKFVNSYLMGNTKTKNPVFLFLDKNGDGTVTAKEFAEAVTQMTGKSISVNEADEFLTPFYDDDTKELSTNHFAQAMVTFLSQRI